MSSTLITSEMFLFTEKHSRQERLKVDSTIQSVDGTSDGSKVESMFPKELEVDGEFVCFVLFLFVLFM